MGIIEDIKRMQLEGKSEQEITSALQSRGFPSSSVQEALSQSRIKDAVTASPDPSNNASFESSDDLVKARAQSLNAMEPSLLNPAQSSAVATAPLPTYAQEYNPQEYGQPQEQQYQQEYAAYAPTSADTISEIAEQVVAEKLYSLRQNLEKTLDLKNSIETRMSYLDERLKKIEKIIDRLQLSILQKVGEHMSSVDDLKNELIETQKSFKSLLPASQRSASPPQEQNPL